MHLACAKTTLPCGSASAEPEAPVSAVKYLAAAGQRPLPGHNPPHTPPAACHPRPQVCKHWRSRGYCLYGQRCVFRHPPECLAVLATQRAQTAALQAAAGSTNSSACGTGAAQRPRQRRAPPRNKFRASAFRRCGLLGGGLEVWCAQPRPRLLLLLLLPPLLPQLPCNPPPLPHCPARFLIDTFGREKLREGAGVLGEAPGNPQVVWGSIGERWPLPAACCLLAVACTSLAC